MFSLQDLPSTPSLRTACGHTSTLRLGCFFHRQTLDKDEETCTLFTEGTPVGPVREKGREVGNVEARGRGGQGAEVWGPWWEEVMGIHAEWFQLEGRSWGASLTPSF